MPASEILPQDIIRQIASALYQSCRRIDHLDTLIFELARVSRNLRDTVISILIPSEYEFRLQLPREPELATPIELVRHRFSLCDILTRAESFDEEKNQVVMCAEKAKTEELVLVLKYKERQVVKMIKRWETEIEQAKRAATEAKKRARAQRRAWEQDNWMAEMRVQLEMNLMIDNRETTDG